MVFVADGVSGKYLFITFIYHLLLCVYVKMANENRVHDLELEVWLLCVQMYIFFCFDREIHN